MERAAGVGVENKGGTDTGTETADPSTTRDRIPGPPPDNPGSPGQPSRLESHARARQSQEQNGSQQTEATGCGAQADGRREGKPSSPQGGGTEKAEASGKPESGQAGRRDEEPRSRDSGTQSGGHTAGGRDRPQGQASEREADTRVEPADRPASSARPYTLPADNPGSPGQPSRLESHARAREAQQQRNAQNAEGTGGGSGGQSGEARDGKPTPPQEGNRADKAAPAGQAEAGATGRDTHAEGHGEREAADGEGVRQDGRPPEAPPADTPAASGGEASGERDRPASPPSGEQAGGPAPETGRPQDREHSPLPGQDNAAALSDSGTPPGTEQNPQGTDKQGADEQGDSPPRPEPATETGDRTTRPTPTPPDSTHGTPEPSDRDAQPVRETGTNSQAPDGHADNGRTTPPEAPESAEAGESGAEQPAHRSQDRPGTEQPGEAATGTLDRGTTSDAPSVPQEGEPAQPGTETREAVAGGTAPDSGTDDQRNTDDAPPPSEETDQSAGAPEPPGEYDGDHGKKGQEDGSEQDPDETNQTNPEAPANPIISNVYTDGRGQVHVEPRYGREHTSEPGAEVARNQPETTEPAQLPDREDLDPVGAQGGEAERGELRDPEDDPESRDYQDGDPDKPSRRLDLAREAFAKADDIKDSIEKLTDPAQKHLERVQPTGQTCGTRPNFDHIKAGDSQLQIGNAAIGIFTTGVLMVETGRMGVRLVRNLLGRNHDRN